VNYSQPSGVLAVALAEHGRLITKIRRLHRLSHDTYIGKNGNEIRSKNAPTMNSFCRFPFLESLCVWVCECGRVRSKSIRDWLDWNAVNRIDSLFPSILLSNESVEGIFLNEALIVFVVHLTISSLSLSLSLSLAVARRLNQLMDDVHWSALGWTW